MTTAESEEAKRNEAGGRGALAPWRRAVLAAATLAVAWVAAGDARDEGTRPPEGLIESPAPAGSEREGGPHFRRGWVTPPAHTPAVHASSILALPGGDRLAAWYGGTREGARDVAVFVSRLPAGSQQWTAPERVVDRERAEAELERVVKKVGNAVVFPDRSGRLWMVYVTVSMGGWSGSALNVKMSADDGRTWSRSRRLTVNPFLNVSSLVRNKPILATDGRIGLPVYHELAVKFPQMLWLTPGEDGSISEYRIRSLATEPDLIQPTLVPLDGDRVLMLLRNQSGERRLRTAYSEDAGWTWSGTEARGLPNPDAAVDALRLRDGRILLVYNDATSGRDNLRLALSSDDGATWRRGPTIEAATGKEYSYPFLAEDRDGRIHLTYTWERRRIRHVEFNVAWLDRPGAGAMEAAQ